MENNSNANRRLLRIRTEELNLSQAELSKALNISQSIVSRSEDPPKKISLPLLLKIQEVYGINATWILTGIGPVYITGTVDVGSLHDKLLSLNKYDFDFIEAYLSLTEDKQRMFRAFLSAFNAMFEDIEDGI